MRYLKTFENLEKFSTGVIEIETFIKNNLAYILDEGFTFKVNFNKYDGRINYTVKLDNISALNNNRNQLIFNWDDVKDDLIPFLELLNDTYTLDSYSPEDKSLLIDTGNWNFYKNGQKRWYNIEEFIDDTIDNIKIKFISFIITGKK
jgi:hypothetical protein